MGSSSSLSPDMGRINPFNRRLRFGYTASGVPAIRWGMLVLVLLSIFLGLVYLLSIFPGLVYLLSTFMGLVYLSSIFPDLLHRLDRHLSVLRGGSGATSSSSGQDFHHPLDALSARSIIDAPSVLLQPSDDLLHRLDRHLSVLRRGSGATSSSSGQDFHHLLDALSARSIIDAPSVLLQPSDVTQFGQLTKGDPVFMPRNPQKLKNVDDIKVISLGLLPLTQWYRRILFKAKIPTEIEPSPLGSRPTSKVLAQDEEQGRRQPKVHKWPDPIDPIDPAKAISPRSFSPTHAGSTGAPSQGKEPRRQRAVRKIAQGIIDFVPYPLFALVTKSSGSSRLAISFCVWKLLKMLPLVAAVPVGRPTIETVPTDNPTSAISEVTKITGAVCSVILVLSIVLRQLYNTLAPQPQAPPQAPRRRRRRAPPLQGP